MTQLEYHEFDRCGHDPVTEKHARDEFFAVFDSGRTDIALEDWHGHKLDRRLLTLLQKS